MTPEERAEAWLKAEHLWCRDYHECSPRYQRDAGCKCTAERASLAATIREAEQAIRAASNPEPAAMSPSNREANDAEDTR